MWNKAIISIFLSLYTIHLHADVTIRYELIKKDHKNPLTQVFIKSNLLRIDQVEKHQPDILFNTQNGEIVQLNDHSQQFFKTDLQTLAMYLNMYRTNRGLIQGLVDQGIQQLDPLQRKQVQQMMLNLNQPGVSRNDISIKASHKKSQILGVSCEVISIYQKSKKLRDVCMARYQSIDLSNSDIRGLEKIRYIIKQFKQSTPYPDLFSIMARGIEQFQGVPLKVVEYSSKGNTRYIIQAKSISLRSIPFQAYRIPNHYTEKAMPFL